MERFSPIWRKEAPSEGVSETIIEKVSTFLSGYESLTLELREKSIRELLIELGEPAESIPQAVLQKRVSKPAGTQQMGARTNRSRRNQADAPQDPREQTVATLSQATQARHTQKSTNRSKRVNGTLDSSVQIIPGIGPQNAKALEKQGVYAIRDFLYYYPRRYDDYSKFKPINKLIPGETVSIVSVVYSVETFTRGRYQITEAWIGDGTGKMRISWFNQPWIANQLKVEQTFVFSGKVDTYLGKPLMSAPDFEQADQENLNTGRIVPVYPVNANLRQNYLRRMMFNTVRYWAETLEEFIPEDVLESADLLPLSNAIEQVHFPDSDSMLALAQRRLAFNEIFLMQLNVLSQKRTWKAVSANKFRLDDEQMNHWTDQLPYQLTGAQWKTLNEIRGDIDSGQPMNRLIQGDVGSGKTVVALLAAMIVSHAGGQSALMAPTSILAEQHYRTFTRLLEQTQGQDWSPSFSADRVALLVGSTPEAEKRIIREKLASGETLIVIGTHALLEDPVQFRNLELVVIDEQHRFGVEQRAILRAKGTSPHLAVMTATPIPRSLALTIYGDLDLSVIDEMPVGRLPIKTYVMDSLARERVYRLISNEIACGHQAFIIYPLVESGEDESKEGSAAVESWETLQKAVFPDNRVALLHGRMKGEEKDNILEAFRRKEYDILVSTSVIEVGVDIPNATVMLIEGADRFGLAQLHQFRGRVGRGADQAYCILVPEKDSTFENERLTAMTQTNDGFKLAEIDLNQRGPGDFLGERQSGFMDLKMASLTDARLIELARIEAEKIFAEDPELNQEAHAALKKRLTENQTKTLGEAS